MIPLADRPVFAVGRTTYTWVDVVASARSAGSWDAVVRRTREGLACRAHALALGQDVPADELQAEARSFRYAHDLLAADELSAWLDRWAIGLEDWLGYLSRRLLRERREGGVPPLGNAEPPAVDEAVWVEAACSGDLAGFARALAARAAVWDHEVGGALVPEPEMLEDAFARFCARAVTEDSVVREVERHGLDWLRVEVETAIFADAETAREGALCVREDGLALADVAHLARAEVRLLGGLLDELDPTLADALVSARPGDLVGPVSLGDEVVLALLRSKRPSTQEDPEARARAERAVVLRAVEREERDRVRWLEHL